MARRTPRPGRQLAVFFLALAATFGLVAVAGSWTPKLGLDLQGGTRITLRAEEQGLTPESLAEARDIIDSRVNSTGVAEAEVTIQGDNIIVVEVPGENRPELEETVKRQAQLRFRLVARSEFVGTGVDLGDPSTPGEGIFVPPSATPTPTIPAPSPSTSASESPSGGAPAPRLREYAAAATDGPSDDATSADPTDAATNSPEPEPEPEPTAEPSAEPSATATDVATQLAWMANPDADSLVAFNAYVCPSDGIDLELVDDPKKPLITCDDEGTKYLLSPAVIEGTDLKDVEVLTPGQQNLEWGVVLDIGGDGQEAFLEVTQALAGTNQQFAIVLDGTVLSAPVVQAVISDGRSQITGSFTESSAQSLTSSLRFGALPISFSPDVLNETVGPSLAGNQLEAGLWAGGTGLLIVMVYCLFYYRGLGVVVIASLFMAAALTYALVLLLSQAAGFTLSLPGIAGLIVAVGITADSFVVFFERIRDEMRDGKSMRVAVEAGWVRARQTCLAADAVSLLAAVVLYLTAAGVVKGFAFALGLSTLIDLAVFFWFTKPMVSWLATFPFFQSGHRWSGLSTETIGEAQEGVA